MPDDDEEEEEAKEEKLPDQPENPDEKPETEQLENGSNPAEDVTETGNEKPIEEEPPTKAEEEEPKIENDSNEIEKSAENIEDIKPQVPKNLSKRSLIRAARSRTRSRGRPLTMKRRMMMDTQKRLRTTGNGITASSGTKTAKRRTRMTKPKWIRTRII